MKIYLRQESAFRRRLKFVLTLMIFFCSALPLYVAAQSSLQPRQLVLEEFEFIGNTKTSPAVILRHLTLKKGDTITPDGIEFSRQRLARTNFFKDVNVYARPGSEKGKIILIVEVKERHWPYFQFEGGHSDLDGWYFVPASLRFDNAFGHGSRLGLKWQLGDRLSKLALAYGNEWFNIVNVDFELFTAGKDFVHYFGALSASQLVDYGGLKVQLSGTEGFTKYLFARYRAVNYNPEDFATREDDVVLDPGQLPGNIVDDLGKTKIRAFALGLHVDTRDNPVYPQKGLWGAVTAEISDDQGQQLTEYLGLTFDGRMYQKISNTNVLALHAKGGHVGEDAPFYERFYLGGANSLRGFPERRLTPEGWGTKFFLASAEYRFPITRKNFPFHKSSGVIFFDTGGIWEHNQTPRLKDLTSSIGIGFRTKLPVIGILRFDFAFPLDKIDQNDYKFHLSLGHTF